MRGERGVENHQGTKRGIVLTALLSRYNLQQSMLAPLSRFGSESACEDVVNRVKDVNEHWQM